MRVTLSRASALTAGLAVVNVSRLPGFAWEIGAVVWGVVLWRIVVGAEGKPLTSRRLRLPFEGLAVLFGVVSLHALAAGSDAPLLVLLTLIAVVQTLLLVRAQSSFVVFLTLLLSSIHVAGSAFLRHDVVTLAVLAVWGILLAWALILLERRAAEERPPRTRGSARRLRVGAAGALPPGAVPRTVAGICSIGFLAGVVLYVVVPRPDLPAEDAGGNEEVDTGPAVAEHALPEARDPTAWLSGPDESSQGLRLGDVGRIKLDLTPYFEVELPRGRSPRLRELTYDVYDRGTWTALEAGEGIRPTEALQPNGASGGWIDLGREPDRYRGYDVRITLYRGPQRRLYLERDPVRVRLLRRGRPLPTALKRRDNERTDSFLPMHVGDVVVERAVPPVSDPSALEAARSDARISPRASFLHLPEYCRPLVALAKGVVGPETNAWKQALALERWLESSEFTYTLQMPVVDRNQPVMDFLLERRQGHCEYFASSMALLLRALGRPSRVVRGFRGGDFLADRGTWMLRGMHYHLWTEMYFEDLGWIPIDATPPDNQAADANEVITREADRPSAKERQLSFAESFLGYGPEERRAVAEAIGWFLARYVREPLAFVFGVRGGFAGFAVVLLLLWGLRRRVRRTRLAASIGVSTRRLPEGPYGRALAVLARHGWRRKPPQTAREFERAVERLAPAVGPPLAHLTRLYERERFGGSQLDREELARAKQEVAALAEAADDARSRRTKDR